ncbi:hypothetical protein nbrc107696_23120 [Gordonia spumicola]|uniref:Lipid/polyisoprenoid-binding YceI-like domain-containing protein n=1 Tax=Gordonia spumicola TaxID=589161 RepID=A0A7I9V8Z0_9ACTN|nr:YceI family protein [Gordonia spumicola]GEE01866.1 hypothetical protein nbrc107696_23120 [Gordonia spumicola]
MTTLQFGPDNGDLTITTGVAGKAARTGHRLTIGFTEWSATVDGEQPTRVRVVVNVTSLQVRSAEGGLTPMSAPEKLVARANALKSLKADKHPEIVFDGSDVTADGDGYRIAGTLTILGSSTPHTVTVAPSQGRVVGETTVRQTDVGVKPYSLMMGALKVADDVTVRLSLGLGD